MRLFPRNPGPGKGHKRRPELSDKAKAHRLLDNWRAGEKYPQIAVIRALRQTGDSA